MGTFTVQLERFRTKSTNTIALVLRRTALELSTRVIMKTPVDTGRARGSWVAGVGSPSGWMPGEGSTDSAGSAAIARCASTIGRWDPSKGTSLFVVSNLSYIRTLEFGGYPTSPVRGSRIRGSKPARYEIKSVGGFSRRAPAGMVRTTIKEFSYIAATATASARK